MNEGRSWQLSPSITYKRAVQNAGGHSEGQSDEPSAREQTDQRLPARIHARKIMRIKPGRVYGFLSSASSEEISIIETDTPS
jgi:hypothetical protein